MKTNLPRKQTNAVATTEPSRQLDWIPAELNFNVTRATYMGGILKCPDLPAPLAARSSLQP
ncbi:MULTISPECIES: hypothetical protein [unclassified Pseudomonas]|uniref:hypothetical protein n=1 Tax=unclassified Pseudomonas TaxID=196821 RepID=UPI001CBAF410|nr:MULTISPECIES: hypothetical protein [unclassified Pseudomonas]